MALINRRTLLYTFGLASVSAPLLPAQTPVTRKVSMANPGESRPPLLKPFRSNTKCNSAPVSIAVPFPSMTFFVPRVTRFDQFFPQLLKEGARERSQS
jgi:hypothetical protein